MKCAAQAVVMLILGWLTAPVVRPALADTYDEIGRVRAALERIAKAQEYIAEHCTK